MSDNNAIMVGIASPSKLGRYLSITGGTSYLHQDQDKFSSFAGFLIYFVRSRQATVERTTAARLRSVVGDSAEFVYNTDYVTVEDHIKKNGIGDIADLYFDHLKSAIPQRINKVEATNWLGEYSDEPQLEVIMDALAGGVYLCVPAPEWMQEGFHRFWKWLTLHKGSPIWPK